MHEGYISKAAIMAVILWALSFGLIAAGWVVTLLSPHAWLTAGMLAATGCVMSAAAAVSHILIFVHRMCALIRVTSGLEQAGRGDLRSIGG